MSLLLTLVQLLPSILSAIKAVEDVVGSGKGATKKAIVLSAISAAAAVGEKVPNKTVDAVSGLVDTVVGQLNAAGVLSPSQPPPGAAPAPTPNA